MDKRLSDFTTHYQARVETVLQELFTHIPAHDTKLLEAMQYSLLNGGKRIRPLLCYAAAQAVDAINKDTDTLATAVECMHVYSLIHDDLPAMDDDELRRGKPTCHIAFDEATAILAGDALQCLAFENIAQSNMSDNTKVKAITELSKAAGAQGMVMGQAIDLQSVDTELSLNDLERMHRHKTGALIESAVVLGAISAQADETTTAELRHYAQALGLAFQVQDDILDVVSDTETLGKTQGADESRNKPTYVSLLGLEGAKAKASALCDEATAISDALGENGHILSALARYVVNRSH